MAFEARTAAISLLALASLGGAPAAAQTGQGLCGDPQGFCQRFLNPACLQSLGAGSTAAAGEECPAQLDAYRTCLSGAAEVCGGRPSAEAAGAGEACDAEDARSLWAELKDSDHPAELDAFAEACSTRPQAALARARAERLRSAGAAHGSSAQGLASAPSAEIGGVYSIDAPVVRLLSGPDGGASARSIGSLARESSVRIMGQSADGRFFQVDVLGAIAGSNLRAGRGWIEADAARRAPASMAPAPVEAGDDAVVETYVLSIASAPDASSSILSGLGFLKKGSTLRVIELFEDSDEGLYARVELIEAVEGSQMTAPVGWVPAASLRKAR